LDATGCGVAKPGAMATMHLTAPTSRAAIDAGLADLRRGAAAWVAHPVSRKIALLLACRSHVSRSSRRWIEAAARAKGLTGTPLAGEEAFSGPWAVLFALNRYVETLGDIERYGSPQLDPGRVRERPDGRVVAHVFPSRRSDRMLLNGIHAEVWMQPGVTRDTLAQTMGVWYRAATPRRPHVALVLGAGNIASIAPLDVLYKMIAEGAVCMLKMNPVNDYLGPILEHALAPLVEGGFLRFAYGGAEVGKYLCAHPLVDDIHITGSDRTHDAIVRELHAAKPITSELGNVSPTIVVPGPWSDADVRFQAENVVTQKMHNGGFNCIASQVLVLPSGWETTPKLLAAVERVMRDLPDRPAYYPGAAQRCESICASHRAQRFGRDGAGFVARAIVAVDPSDESEPAFTNEAFCSALVTVELPGETETFLRHAVAFSNERLRGTLGASLIAHPRTMREHARAFDRALDELRYGCIGVNAWSGVGFLLAQLPWGAYPGHTLDDIGSGIGVVHNSHLFSRSEKSIVYAPFAPFPRSLFGYGATLLPKPPWFVTHRNQASIGELLCDFEVTQSPLALARIAALAISG
jgi:aldehyde dehydrogenase (NAD(P)+)